MDLGIIDNDNDNDNDNKMNRGSNGVNMDNNRISLNKSSNLDGSDNVDIGVGNPCETEKPTNEDCCASTNSCGVSTLLLKIEIASDTMKSIMKGEKSLEITINDENDKRNNARKRVPFSMVSCDSRNMNINLNNCKVILYSNCMNNVNSVGQLFGDATAMANGGAGTGGHGGDSISRGGNGGAAGAGGDANGRGGNGTGVLNHGPINITFGKVEMGEEIEIARGGRRDARGGTSACAARARPRARVHGARHGKEDCNEAHQSQMQCQGQGQEEGLNNTYDAAMQCDIDEKPQSQAKGGLQGQVPLVPLNSHAQGGAPLLPQTGPNNNNNNNNNNGNRSDNNDYQGGAGARGLGQYDAPFLNQPSLPYGAYGPLRSTSHANPYIGGPLLHFPSYLMNSHSNGPSMPPHVSLYLNTQQLKHQNIINQKNLNVSKKSDMKIDTNLKLQKILEELREEGYSVTITKEKENYDHNNNNNNNNNDDNDDEDDDDDIAFDKNMKSNATDTDT